MPVVLRIRGYRFWFYSADLDEPPHVHVGRDGKEAKYWLDPLALVRPGRFREQELSEIARILTEFRNDVLDAWETERSKRDDRRQG